MAQTPLTAVMTFKDPVNGPTAIKNLLRDHGAEILAKVKESAFIHFARFVFLELGGEKQFAIITTYDGDFDDYMDVFIDKLGPVFDIMLVHMKDAPRTPVMENRQAFKDYVRRLDPKPAAFFSAYPDLTVRNILELEQGGSLD